MAIAVVETVNFGLRYLVEAAAGRGHEVILLTGDRSRYTYEFSSGLADEIDIIDIDTTDVDKMVEILREVPDLAGVVRMTDRWSLQALAVAQRLGLPYQSAAAVELMRNKALLRRHLYDNGFSRSPGLTVHPRTADLEELTRILPFPCVVKDVAGSASQNVWLVRNSKELACVLTVAREADDLRGEALAVEPYFIGPMYSAETVSWKGETKIIGVSSRALSPEPYFREEISSFPVLFPEAKQAALAEWISEILSSVDYDGVTHTEFIVTTEGFEIVEINARIGGALIGECVNRSLGINFHSAFVDLALGRRPQVMDIRPEIRQGATAVAIYAPRTGVFEAIDGTGTLSDHPGAPELYLGRSSGEVIPTTIDQRGGIGLVIANGETAELSLQNAMSAAGKLTVRMRGGSRAQDV
ncbi:argininosuccinate lyase [Planotetraspora thailandica]|uniref:Argininosuccinate lyase n=1 Tax=Planotetraspora thailandica TaxID=487172 RepID=A0A8J3Y0V6_9ACTN|nr:ATP-grasp domain-containing protein [Planotetraspora thailandica]GII58788.1 argininosuccinate lyase [Planotetraspora thailandica]